MNTHPKHLPADERRAVTVESVVALAGSQNPSEITTAAIAKHMNLTQGALFRHFPNKGSHLAGGHGVGSRAPISQNRSIRTRNRVALGSHGGDVHESYRIRS